MRQKNRLGKILLTILIIAIILPLMGIFWFGRRLCPCFKSAFDSLFYGLFFNQSSRFILESYTPLMQTLLENLHRGLNWSTLIYICLSANDVAFSIIYGLFPLAVTVYFYRKQDKFKKVWFRKRWEEIMGNLTWRRKSSAFYIAIFCYRRLLAALLVVFLADFPWAQVMLTVFFQLERGYRDGSFIPIQVPIGKNSRFSERGKHYALRVSSVLVHGLCA